MRWIRLWHPETDMDRQIMGTDPVTLSEAPKGVGREVRLATDAETGRFGRLALPAPREQPSSRGV